MKVAKYNKKKYSASTSSSSSAGGGGGYGGPTVAPSPVDLTDIYARLSALEQKVASINLDNYLSKTKDDGTPHTLSAGTLVTTVVHSDRYASGQGYSLYDGTAYGLQPALNLKQTVQADSQTVAPFSGATRYFQWTDVPFGRPVLYTFTASTSVTNLTITHEDAEMTFITEFICNDRRVTLESTEVTYTVDGGDDGTLTPDENNRCRMPLTTGTHDYDISVVWTALVYLPQGSTMPSSVQVKIYGTDSEHDQTEVSWVNSVTGYHTRITPSDTTILKDEDDGYSLRWDGLYKISGGTATKLI